MSVDQLDPKRIQDWCDRADKTWEIVHSHFLRPTELASATIYLQRLGDLHYLAWGGFPQAERQILAIARKELDLDISQMPLSALSITGNFLFDPASHRDFLGAMLGTGIERDQVGDIIVSGDRGCQAIVANHLVSYLEINLTQVRTVPVKTKPIDLSQLQIRPPQQKEIVTTEASLRLDALASAGFSMSRSKMVDLINAEEVRVNWQPVKSPSQQLQTGDIVTVQGKGRMTVGEIMLTKKERYRIHLLRLI
jgi:photosystem II S4 domain protein